MRSMTGFASVTHGDVTLTLKSVNGKTLDIHFHLPSAFEAVEAALRNTIREYVARGTLQVRVAWNLQREMGLNRPLLNAWLSAFTEASAELDLPAKPDLNAALRLPGIFEHTTHTSEPPELLPLLRTALIELNAFRDREGAQLTEELAGRARHLGRIADELEGLRSGASAAFHHRLSTRLQELLGAVVDPQRIALEAAVLVERSDVSEEIVRLRTHVEQLVTLLHEQGEVGKKIDFLLQEMNREANTILSKTGGLGEIGLRITELGIAAKSEIEKIREQALNLE